MGLFSDIISTIRQPPPSTGGPGLETLLLHEIGRAMSSSTAGGDQTLCLICETVTTLLKVEKCLLFQLEPNLGRMTLRCCRGNVESDFLSQEEIALGLGIFGDVIEQGQALRWDSSLDAPRELRVVFEQLDLHTFLVAPIKMGEEALGLLIADSPIDARPFDSRDVHLIEVLANLAAITETNKTLISRLRKKARGLQALSELSRALASTRHVEALLKLIQDKALELTHAKSCVILIRSDDDGCLVVRSSVGMAAEVVDGRRFGPGEGISGWALLTGETQIVPDVKKDPRYINGDELACSEMAVPLVLRDEVIGVLAVDAHHLDAFGDLERQLLEAFAAHAVIALDNAREFERLEQ